VVPSSGWSPGPPGATQSRAAPLPRATSHRERPMRRVRVPHRERPVRHVCVSASLDSIAPGRDDGRD
jgi:hypothetical protein